MTERKTRKPRTEAMSNSKSGVLGVFWNHWASKWQAKIYIDGVNRNLGLYVEFEDAVAARKAAEAERDGLDLL